MGHVLNAANENYAYTNICIDVHDYKLAAVDEEFDLYKGDFWNIHQPPLNAFKTLSTFSLQKTLCISRSLSHQLQQMISLPRSVYNTLSFPLYLLYEMQISFPEQ